MSCDNKVICANRIKLFAAFNRKVGRKSFIAAYRFTCFQALLQFISAIFI